MNNRNIGGNMNGTSTSINRRSFLKGAAICAVGATTGLSLAGCGQSGSSAQQSSGPSGPVSGNNKEVIVTMTPTSEPSAGFNPLFSWGCGEHVHEPLIQSTLFTTDADLNFVNDLATSYECSEDGLTWTFNIRDDVKFTDGEPLTAKDVAFTINGIIENEASEADLSMVKSAEATSKTTCVLHLKKPFNAMLYTLAVVGIVPEHAYDAKTYGENPIGSGRYMLEQWDRGQQVIFKANPDYYGEAPLMDRVVVLFMEEDTSLAAANSAQADVAYTAATIVDSANPSGYEVLNCKSVDSRGISLPCIKSGTTKKDGGEKYAAGNDVTCNLELRRAINYGVNRDTMIENVLNGYGTKAFSVSDGMPWYNPQMQVEYDVAAAKSEMESAGWKLGEDGIYAKDGVRAEFECYYSASDSVRQALANEFANQMKEIGIEVKPVGSGWTKDPSGIYAHQYSDPVLWGWGSNSPVELYTLHYSESSGNYAVYENDKIDAHLDEALAATTVEQSYPDWQAATWDGETGYAPQGGAPWVWLCNIDHLYFKRNGLVVAKQKPHPHGHGWSLVNNVDKWYWE